MRTLSFLFLAGVIGLAALAWASPGFRRTVGSILRQQGWISEYQDGGRYRRRVEGHRSANGDLPESCVVLLGDSLIERFPDDLTNPLGCVNRGISGDRIRHVGARLGPSALEAPCGRVGLLVGINDLMHEGAAPATVIDGILEIAEALAESKEVFVHTLSPAEDPLGWLAGPIREVNEGLAATIAVRGGAIRLIDLHAALSAPSDGAVAGSGSTRDGIHLRRAGYLRWAALLDDALATSERESGVDGGRQ